MAEKPTGVYDSSIKLPEGPGVGDEPKRKTEAMAGETITSIVEDYIVQEKEFNQKLDDLKNESLEVGAQLEAYSVAKKREDQIFWALAGGRKLSNEDSQWLENWQPEDKKQTMLRASNINDEQDETLKEMVVARGELPKEPFSEHEAKLLGNYEAHLFEQEEAGRQMVAIIRDAVDTNNLSAAELREVKGHEAVFARAELDAVMTMGKIVERLSTRFPDRANEFRERLGAINKARWDAKVAIVEPIDEDVAVFKQEEIKAKAAEFVGQPGVPTEVQETVVGRVTKKEQFPVYTQRAVGQVVSRPISRKELFLKGPLAERYSLAQRRFETLEAALEKAIAEGQDNPQMGEAVYALAYRYNLVSLSLRKLKKEMQIELFEEEEAHEEKIKREEEKTEKERQKTDEKLQRQVKREQFKRLLGEKTTLIRQLAARFKK